jgi:hypothetical protein
LGETNLPNSEKPRKDEMGKWSLRNSGCQVENESRKEKVRQKQEPEKQGYVVFPEPLCVKTDQSLSAEIPL